MSLKALHSFNTICRLGSFADAAEVLGRTQSAISMQIKTLEQELGVALFDRSTRPPRLTQMGRHFLQHSREIVHRYETAVAAISVELPFHETFQLGVIPTALSSLAPAALARLGRRYPDARVNMVTGMTGSLVDQLVDGTLDAALINEPRLLPEDFTFQIVAEQRLIVIVPAGQAFQDDTMALSSYPYIRFNRRAHVADVIAARIKARGITVRQSMEIESLDAIYRMVHYGLGVSVVPEQSPADSLLPPVGVLPFGIPPVTRRIGIAYRADTVKMTATQALVDAFTTVARSG